MGGPSTGHMSSEAKKESMRLECFLTFRESHVTTIGRHTSTTRIASMCCAILTMHESSQASSRMRGISGHNKCGIYWNGSISLLKKPMVDYHPALKLPFASSTGRSLPEGRKNVLQLLRFLVNVEEQNNLKPVICSNGSRSSKKRPSDSLQARSFRLRTIWQSVIYG